MSDASDYFSRKGVQKRRPSPRRFARPEDPEELRYIASCWARDPQMVTALAGLDRDRLREAGRHAWQTRDPYSWVRTW